MTVDRTKVKQQLEELRPKISEMRKILRPMDIETMDKTFETDVTSGKVSNAVDYLIGIYETHLAFYLALMTMAISGYSMPSERLLEMSAAGLISSFEKLEIELAREELTNRI